jgi:integrase
MAIFKRGNVYWFHFLSNGEHIQKSTRQGNPRVARQIEAAYRTALAKGEAGIVECKPSPALKDFAQRFTACIQVRCTEKPATIAFYVEKLTHLLEFEPLANARLDRIDEALIESYVQERSKATGRRKATLAPATVNRDLATLRRALRLAYEWHVIDRVPRIRLLPGEQNREFVLSHASEETYFSACPHPLRDIALVIVDAGLRTSEALWLEWRYVHLEPAPGAKHGYIHIPGGKSKNARRNVPITDRLAQMLLTRSLESKSVYVFPSKTGRPYHVRSVDHLHEKVRAALQMSAEFVVYSLRHTYGTRLGEAGADAFTIMRLMGHSSVTVSQRYVHPTPEAMERAVEKLQAMNTKVAKSLRGEQKRQLPATVSATVGGGEASSGKKVL